MFSFPRILQLNKLKVALSHIRGLQTQKISNIAPVFTQIPNLSNSWIYQQNDQVKFPISRISKIEYQMV
ncbi:hypothetical protein JTB14_011785 [Gonioctena quinquepunctata]|nr:hypothetical protein JTB14_011785 [Gonioctena quinquepunctata]